MAGAPAPGDAQTPFEAVIDAVEEMIITTDGDGRIVHLNRSAKDKLGLSGVSALQRPFDEALAEVFSDERGKSFLELVRKGILAGNLDAHQELIPNVGPAALACRAHAISLSAGGGMERGAVLLFVDDSDRAALEEADSRLFALQDLVIRVLGHDLKAPIQVIQGAIELEETASRPTPRTSTARRSRATSCASGGRSPG